MARTSLQRCFSSCIVLLRSCHNILRLRSGLFLNHCNTLILFFSNHSLAAWHHCAIVGPSFNKALAIGQIVSHCGFKTSPNNHPPPTMLDSHLRCWYALFCYHDLICPQDSVQQDLLFVRMHISKTKPKRSHSLKQKSLSPDSSLEQAKLVHMRSCFNCTVVNFNI